MSTLYYRFSNYATTTLATGITAASSSLQVVAGGGALFPPLAVNEAFVITLIRSGSPTVREIVIVTGHSTDNFTGLVRGTEGTTAIAWNAGDTVELRVTAGTMRTLAQAFDIQSQGTNYGVDVGSANNYAVVLSPQINSSVVGMPIRWVAAHTNTGASNFSDGIHGAPLRTSEGGDLTPGTIVNGGIYTCFWNGSYFQLDSQRVNFTNLAGSILNGQVPSGAVTQWQGALALLFTQISGTLLPAQVPANMVLPGAPSAATAAPSTSNTQLATTAFANPAGVSNANGICIPFPSGYKLQAGLVNPNGGTVHVTFPSPFTTIVFPTLGSVASGSVQSWIPSGTISLSGMNVANTGGQTYWMAFGL